MRNRLLALGFASVLGVVAIIGLRAESSAGGTTFGNTSLNGSYGFHDEGSGNVTISGTPVDEAFDQVGVASYDGKGGIRASSTITYRFPFSNEPGFVCKVKYKGTYSVNPDGSGTTSQHGTITSGPCPDVDVTSAFALSNGGNKISYVVTSAESTPTNVVNNLVDAGEATAQ